MTPADTAAAIRLIEADRERYPIIADLPDDLRAALEPEERPKRYASVLALLIVEAENRATRDEVHACEFVQSVTCPQCSNRAILRAIFHAAKEAARLLDAQRRDEADALDRSRSVNAELRDRNQALLLKVAVLREAIGTLHEEIEALKCERMRESA
jgi:hypothetical protein